MKKLGVGFLYGLVFAWWVFQAYTSSEKRPVFIALAALSFLGFGARLALVELKSRRLKLEKAARSGARR